MSVPEVAFVIKLPVLAHGLGAYRWLQEDVMADSLQVSCQSSSGCMEATVADDAVQCVFILAHGFLWTDEDWIPIIKAVSESSRCISLDLPSQGRSELQQYAVLNEATNPSLSLETLAEVLTNLKEINPGFIPSGRYSSAPYTVPVPWPPSL
ncbi:hypothetical protein MLD38_015628 [Melastoma candidum]|uniref:Uncharacterized protein n=1 Tax=Melastoma candidum TaxID=119954 RepID=A0ACB9RKD9_9MYRT|nr:hypothetical protein MLD38_015628 [Melastoma candidum]